MEKLEKLRISLGAISKPLSSKKMKTGDWGTEFPIVDNEKCIGCRDCEITCPDACIRVFKKNKKRFDVVVDYEYCKGCGICSSICQTEAITMELKDVYKV
jgi:pyruvate ferredoxin oxidoreductase delta subunit